MNSLICFLFLWACVNGFNINTGFKYLGALSVGKSLTSFENYEDLDDETIYTFGITEAVGYTPSQSKIYKSDGFWRENFFPITHVWIEYSSSSDLLPAAKELNDETYGRYFAYFIDSLVFEAIEDEEPYFLVSSSISLKTSNNTILAQQISFADASSKTIEFHTISNEGIFPYDGVGKGIVRVLIDLQIYDNREFSPIVPDPEDNPILDQPAVDFCLERTWATNTIGYYCVNPNKFYMCLEEPFKSQSSTQNCPVGTACQCSTLSECSNGNTRSPCSFD